MRRRRRRTSFRYRLRKTLMDRMPVRRHRRFRVVDRRRFMIAQCLLVAVAVAALGLSASVIVRSIRTAKVNESLVALHTVEAGAAPAVEIAAPPMEAQETSRQDGGLTLTFMGMPDGSAIKTAAVATAPTVLHKTTGDILPDMLKLIQTNPDTVGWISINGIVHLPVVYRDNTYYLTHDFNGHHNTSGTLFLDQGSPITAQTQNLLIHGHSMVDGSMFGLLTHYRRLDTLIQHPLISFSTLYEKETYAVFAVLNVDPDAFDYFTHAFFASNADFEAYIASIRAHSLYDVPIDVQPTDALLTLSTCIDDDRLVVVARRLRAGETKDELSSAAEQSQIMT